MIGSDVPPYSKLAREEPVRLVANTMVAWLDGLTEMATDAELRAAFAARGRAWAATRTIEATGPLWATLWGAQP